MSMYRRHLVIVPSKLYVRGVVLRDPLMETTVHAFPGGIKDCARWCRQNGWPASLDKSGRFSANEIREHEAAIPELKD